MKRNNTVILKRTFSNCCFEDVEDLIKYWDRHNGQGFIDMKIEAETDCGYPTGTFMVKFETSIGSMENRWWRNLGEKIEDEMILFFEEMDKSS